MRVPVLMYHMISIANHPEEERYCLSPKKFLKQMRYLKHKGYTPVSCGSLYEYMLNKTADFPEKPVVITFDDGYMDNYENAFPILKEFDFPATVFIVSGLVGRSNSWVGESRMPERRLMNWKEIEYSSRNGIMIGSHTVSHKSLSELNQRTAKAEIENSKKEIEDRLSISVEHFAYPHGKFNESIKKIVKESGYITAYSTIPGFNSKNINPYELRRFEICGTDSLLRFRIKLTYGTNDGRLRVPLRYYLKRVVGSI